MICPAGAGECDGQAIEMSDIVGLPLVLSALEGSIRTFIDTAFAARGLRPTVNIEVDSAGALLDLVRDGHGYSILPYSMVHKSVVRGEVGARHITNDSIGRMLWTGLPTNRPISRLFRSVEQEIRTVAIGTRANGPVDSRDQRRIFTAEPQVRPAHRLSATRRLLPALG